MVDFEARRNPVVVSFDPWAPAGTEEFSYTLREFDPSYSDIDAFIQAEKRGIMLKLCVKYYPLFGWGQATKSELSDEEALKEDYLDFQLFRDELMRAITLRNMLSESPSMVDLAAQGVSVFVHPDGVVASTLLVITANFTEEYRAFLRRGMSNSYAPLGKDFTEYELSDGMISAHLPLTKVEDGLQEVAGNALDALMSLHLGDIVTLTDRGIPFAQSRSMASSLWYCLAESFRGGRAGTCAMCAKPYIAFGERGMKREYCSKRCKDAAERQRKKSKQPTSVKQDASGYKEKVTRGKKGGDQ